MWSVQIGLAKALPPLPSKHRRHECHRIAVDEHVWVWYTRGHAHQVLQSLCSLNQFSLLSSHPKRSHWASLERRRCELGRDHHHQYRFWPLRSIFIFLASCFTRKKSKIEFLNRWQRQGWLPATHATTRSGSFPWGNHAHISPHPPVDSYRFYARRGTISELGELILLYNNI